MIPPFICRLLDWLVAGVVAEAVFAAFFPALRGEFVAWDDRGARRGGGGDGDRRAARGRQSEPRGRARALAAPRRRGLEKAFGGAVWVLDPGAYQMPGVGDKSPGGGDYMVMWTRVLAGDDGAGRDFDMAHFTGPGDMRAFFGCGADDLTGCLGRWLAARAAGAADLRRVDDDPATRRAFLRYYAVRASAAYSAGAHDEWNIFVRINRRRTLGDQVAIFFDGRPASPAEMETEISPGYEVR